MSVVVPKPSGNGISHETVRLTEMERGRASKAKPASTPPDAKVDPSGYDEKAKQKAEKAAEKAKQKDVNFWN